MLAEVTFSSVVSLPLPLVVGFILFVIIAVLYWRSGGRK
jgi:hypothetical protein